MFTPTRPDAWMMWDEWSLRARMEAGFARVCAELAANLPPDTPWVVVDEWRIRAKKHAAAAGEWARDAGRTRARGVKVGVRRMVTDADGATSAIDCAGSTMHVIASVDRVLCPVCGESWPTSSPGELVAVPAHPFQYAERP